MGDEIEKSEDMYKSVGFEGYAKLNVRKLMEPMGYGRIIDMRRRLNCAIYLEKKEIAAADKKRRNRWDDEGSDKKGKTQEEEEEEEYNPTSGSLHQYFGYLLNKEDEEEFRPEEYEERMVMKLLLKLKDGIPHQKKTALRQLIDNARVFGAGRVFNRIFTLLIHPTLDDQERYLLVKAIGRIIYELDELVRPYVFKILVLTRPLLVDEHGEYDPRVEGSEIIYYLSKAAGLATMIDVIRPNIHSCYQDIRMATARAVSVVASALGIPAVLPLLREACQTHDISWEARYTAFFEMPYLS